MFEHMIVATTRRSQLGKTQAPTWFPRSQEQADFLINEIRLNDAYLSAWTLNGHGKVSRCIKGNCPPSAEEYVTEGEYGQACQQWGRRTYG